MIVGCFELFLLLAIIAGLLVLLGRFPVIGRKLFRLLRNRRITGWQLLMGAFFLGFLALMVSEHAHKPGHPLSAILFPVFLISAILLFCWAMLRFLGLSLPDPEPPTRSSENYRKDTPPEPSLLRELGRLLTLLGARISRLGVRDALLVGFLLVAPVFQILILAKEPREDEIFVVMIVLFFWWVVSSATFWALVWIFRLLFRGGCPSLAQLRELLAERLSAQERARLAAHLEICTGCQHRVEGLTAGHHFWPGMARKLSERAAEPEPALRKVMAQLKDHEEETTDNEPALAGDLPLGFLSPSDKPDQLGRLERYEVLEEIGRGGMGVVLKAFDPSLHRVVAIKVLAPQLATSGVARKRFLREAKAAAAVTHDHIVTIHAVEEANGLPYLVMHYVAGQSLQQRIDKDGPLDLPDILRIGMQTASGLAAAHAHGILHRDIKPANILLEEGVQRVKITDFGLARAMDDASLTQSGFVAGSPLYMAPEQARGESLDHRADLFSLGSVLYTMCTGRPPFRAANTLAVLRRVSEDRPRPIRETNPEIPDWLADIVDKLMAKEPSERFQSAAEVEEVLGRQLAQLQHAAWVPPPRPPAPAATPGAVPDLPTSLTICPSCGASLHVPERMVGTLVHCAECGKPFHVEEGSEVIQVARPAPWPPRPRFGWQRIMLRGCIGIVVVGFVLMFLSMLFLRLSYQSRSAEQAAMELSARRAQPPQPGPLPPPSWKSMLEWLPAGATLFGSIDLTPFGSLSLDDAPTQALIHLIAPEAADKVTPDNLGRIRIDGAALARYEDPQSRTNEAVVFLQGQIWSGRKPILDFLRQHKTEQIHVKEGNVPGMPELTSVIVSGPALPFALRIRDDQHVFLARTLTENATEGQNLKALDRLPEVGSRPNIYLFSGHSPSPFGYNPPWIFEALGKIPPDACGAFLGEIPADWRKALTDALMLRECPRSFFCHVRRQGQDVVCSLTLNLDKTGADKILREDLESRRPQVLTVLQRQLPALKNDRQALTLLGSILNAMHWQAVKGSVETRVRINASDLTALGHVLKRVSQRKQEN